MIKVLSEQQIKEICNFLQKTDGYIHQELYNVLSDQCDGQISGYTISEEPLNLNLNGKYLPVQSDIYLLLRSKEAVSEEDAEKAKAALFDIYFPSMKEHIRILMKNQEYAKYYNSNSKYGCAGDGCFYIVWEVFNKVLRKIKIMRNPNTASKFLEVWKYETGLTVGQTFNKAKYSMKIASVYITEFNKIRKYAKKNGLDLEQLSYRTVRPILKLTQGERVFNDFISGRLEISSVEKLSEETDGDIYTIIKEDTPNATGNHAINSSTNTNILYKSLLSLLCDANTTNQQARDLVVVFDTIVDNNMDMEEYNRMIETFGQECIGKHFVKNARNRGCEMILKYAQEHYKEETEAASKERFKKSVGF